MARDAKTYSVIVTANQPTVGDLEMVVATLGGIVRAYPDAVVRLLGAVAATGAAGTTIMLLRVRRDSLAGAIVGEAVTTQIAGPVDVTAPIAVEEARGELSGATYVLTAQINGAPATVTMAELVAVVS